ncbi:MAG: FAD-dependent monooxygenase, partial [Caldimonas sp.]
MNAFDVQIVGAGIVGKSLALAFARLGLKVALQRQASVQRETVDVRAYALSPASVALLRSLKVWDALPAHAATAVYEMHVEGDALGGAIDFSAWQQRIGELAWITDAAVLERELGAAVRFAPHITVTTADVEATLTALCDGAASSRRAALGVGFERQPYGQHAIAARLVAVQPHQGIARQWFRAPDVLALLPFDAPEPDRSYALVWSMPQQRADELMANDDAGFEHALIGATGVAGLKLAGARAAWPLQLGRAERWCGPGWVLLGDAAHVVH